MEVAPGQILEELLMLVNEELKVVSYKWLARNYALPANFAKKILFKFSEQQREKIKTTYLVSGWTKDSSQHVFKVVDSPNLQAVREQLQPVTSMHVYSVAPSTPVDPISLWQEDLIQTKELIKELHVSGPTSSPSVISFVNNGCSAVKFVPQKKKPRVPGANVAKEQVPSPPASASGKASQRGATKAQEGQNKDSDPALAAPPAAEAPSVEPPPAPTPAVDKKPAASGAKQSPPAKGKGNALSNLWSKSAAAKASSKVSTGAAKASTSKRIEDEPTEETFVAATRGVKRAHFSALDDSDDDEDEQADKKADAKACAPSGPAEHEGSDDATHADADACEGGKGKAAMPKKRGRPSKNAKKDSEGPSKRAKGGAAAQEQDDDAAGAEKEAEPSPVEEMVVEDSPPEEPSKPPPKPSIFERQAAKGATTKVQKKVQRTSYNEKGEEVVEEVVEEVEVPVGSVEHKQASMAAGGSKKASPAKASGPSAKASSKPVGKKAPGQKGIQAFFQKK